MASDKVSFAEASLWFAQKSAPNSSGLNEIVSCEIFGDIDSAALARAAVRLQDCIPHLSSVFPAGPGGFPVRKTVIFGGEVVERLDAIALTFTEVIQLVRRLGHRTFDLENGPLYRLHLLERKDSIVFVLSQHHILADAATHVEILTSLERLYLSELQSGKLFEPDAQTSYGLFLKEQEDYLASTAYSDDSDFWHGVLQHRSIKLPPLPLDEIRESAGNQVHSGFYFPELTEALTDFGRREGIQVGSLLQIAFELVLEKFWGQPVPYSVLYDLRTKSTKKVLGLCINPVLFLPERCLDFGQVTAEFMVRAKRSWRHRRYPFMQLAGHSKDLLRDPDNTAANIVFVFDSSSRFAAADAEKDYFHLCMESAGQRLRFAQSEMEILPVGQFSGQVGLNLCVWNWRGRLRVIWHWDRQWISDASVAAVSADYLNLLTLMSSGRVNAGTPVSSIFVELNDMSKEHF